MQRGTGCLQKVNGHDCYIDNAIIPAGDFLNGYQVESLVGLRLDIDMKHISADTVEVGDTLVVGDFGGLEVNEATEGKPYFVVEEKMYLTMPAVKVRVKM